MPKTRINCPNCRQPIMADIEQLFDVGQDPEAKQRLLSGQVNVVQCPHCGYQGMVATPIVYHDPSKELLLTYFPPELNVPRPEQEKAIGALINQAINRLPQEQRKGYLLRPQAVLTMQGMAERILEADGITREMIQEQQQRLALLQRLLSITDEEVLKEVVKQEDKNINSEFFNLLNRLVEASSMGGDQEGARRLVDLQRKLLPLTTAGKQIQEQSQEVEAAIKSLRDLGQGLTREKLLDLFVNAPSDTRVSVLASLARPALDYEFFQMLSKRIEQSKPEEMDRLARLRENLLDMTREIDKAMEARLDQARQTLNAILQASNTEEAIQKNLGGVDEFFVQALNGEMEAAHKAGDLEKISKLQKVVGILQQASAPPPEMALIEEMLDLNDDSARRKWLDEHKEDITPEFMEILTGLMSQTQGGDDQELAARLQAAYRSALKFSMESNLKK